jgi:hypothetical protein
MLGPSGPRISAGRWSLVVSLVVAAAMAAIALLTVSQAGCTDPGRYVARGSGYELVGGCVAADDLSVEPDTAPSAPSTSPDSRFPLRP